MDRKTALVMNQKSLVLGLREPRPMVIETDDTPQFIVQQFRPGCKAYRWVSLNANADEFRSSRPDSDDFSFASEQADLENSPTSRV